MEFFQGIFDSVLSPDVNSILGVVAQVMGAIGVPTELGRNFLDFAELMLTMLFAPIQIITGLFGG